MSRQVSRFSRVIHTPVDHTISSRSRLISQVEEEEEEATLDVEGLLLLLYKTEGSSTTSNLPNQHIGGHPAHEPTSTLRASTCHINKVINLTLVAEGTLPKVVGTSRKSGSPTPTVATAVNRTTIEAAIGTTTKATLDTPIVVVSSEPAVEAPPPPSVAVVTEVVSALRASPPHPARSISVTVRKPCKVSTTGSVI